MNTQRGSIEELPAFYSRPLFRAVTGLLGALLLGLGIYVLLWPAVSGLLAMATGIVFVLLGGNALVAALRGTRAWLARIGPLP